MSIKRNCTSAAAVRMTLQHPFWTEVFYSMEVVEDSPDVPTLGTDGKKLWVNTEFYKKLPLEEQVGVLIHELWHKILLHCSRQGSRDAELWNIACDYVINAGMTTAGYKLPPGGLLDMKYDGWLAEAVYADIMKQVKEAQKSGGSGKPGTDGIPELPEGWQDIKQQGGTPEEVEAAESEIKALVDRAISNAQAMGKLPAGIAAGTIEVFKAAKEPWFNHLHRYMQSLSSSEYNWARLNRRTLKSHGFFSPLHLAESLGQIAVFIDTSGSCYDRQVQSGFTEHMNAILAEARPRSVHVYYFDAAVYEGEVLDAGDMDFRSKPVGGGGTDFCPIFQRLEEDGIDPAVCIILTDLCGSFPKDGPDYPVVWANTEDYGVAPFGETIYVE